MKILAIRGENLASLSGSFEVDLQQAPLAGVGLFAITGPTGAGKSTLLDALCLALYDTAPRLDRGGTPIRAEDPGESDGIRSTDPRTLLRRGAGEGWAEVEFIGLDGDTWRARWSVRRARNRPDGALQKQELRLWRVADGQPFGGTKTETLAAIEARIGLSWHQFSRSVLLAQNDFAAFLDADPKTRSALLERMTGTAIYGEISKAAFDRHKVERERLSALDREIAALAPLGSEERAACEDDLASTEASMRSHELEIERTESAKRWIEADDRLDDALRRAEADAARAAAERAALEPDHQAVLRLEALGPLVDRVRDARVARDRAAEAEQDAAAIAQARAEAHQRLAAADADAAEARAQLLGAERALAQEEPRFDRILALEAQAATLRAQADRAGQDRSLSAQRLDEARAAEREATAALQRAAEAVARSERLLQDPLAATLAARGADLPARLRRLPKLAADADEMSRQAAAARDERARIDAALHEIEVRVAAGEAEVATPLAPPNLSQLDAHRRELARWEAASEAWQRHTERVARAEAAAHAVAEASRAEAVRGERRAALSAAELTLREAQLRHDLTTHSQVLRPGHPCPLCGATRHPFKDSSTLLSAGELARAEAAVAEIRAEVDALSATITRLGTVPAADPVTEPAPDPVPPDAIATARAAVAAAEQELATADRRWRIRAAQTDRLNAARLERAQLHAARERANTTAADREAAVARIRSKRQEEIDHLQLDPHALPAPADALTHADVDAIERRAADLADALQSLSAERTAVERATRELVSATERRLAAEQASAAAETAARDASEALAAARRALEGETGGETLAALRRVVSDRVAHARERLRAADAQVDAARTATDALRGRAEAASAHLAARQEERARAEAVLTAALADGGWSEPPAIDPTWDTERVQAVQAAVKRADDAQVAATARVQERRENLQQHRVERPETALVPAELDAALVTLRRGLQQARAAQIAAIAALRQDDQRREQSDAVRAAITRQQDEVRAWGSIAELIGQADGSKFRNYAQSLTLDVLCHHANRWLAELHPRYALRPVPGTELGLQVQDRHMGDELRPTNTLSGGETFLVALALALGLSALSGRERALGSLFIDEGFGTLDPDTLEVALAALDALQSSGRQVGVISHVPGLAERIGVRIEVRPAGNGVSTLRVLGA